MGLDFVLGKIYEPSHYMLLRKDFILPAGQEDLFGHRSLLRDSLAHYEKPVLHLESHQLQVSLWLELFKLLLLLSRGVFKLTRRGNG